MTSILLIGISFLLLVSIETTASGDPYKEVWDKVDQTHLLSLVRDMTGVNPVKVGSQTFSIKERFSDSSQALFRLYYENYFKQLGLQVNHVDTKNLHEVEAVLPGKSADSVVIVVHYDTLPDVNNPAADDDMSGMAMMMETARILSEYKGRLRNTTRFVATDDEEHGKFGGASLYLKYLQALATQQKFKILVGIDDEQSGWNYGENDLMDAFACNYNKSLVDQIATVAAAYGSMRVSKNDCTIPSDQAAFEALHMPAIMFSEHSGFSNPYADVGGDTIDTLDPAYYLKTSKIGITFSAQQVGID